MVPISIFAGTFSLDCTRLCDYIASKQPLTEEQQELIRQQLQEFETNLFHKRLYLQNLACPWEPIVKSKFIDTSYELGNDNIIDLELHKTQSLMFISAESKLAYLQSPQWHILKTKRLIIANYKCECCGSSSQLQCHHITYERLTRERIDDLVILCGGVKFVIGGAMLSILIFLFPPLYGEGYDTISLLLNGTSSADWDTGDEQFFVLWQLPPVGALSDSDYPVQGICFQCDEWRRRLRWYLRTESVLGMHCRFCVFRTSAMSFIWEELIPEKNFALMGMAGLMSGVSV